MATAQAATASSRVRRTFDADEQPREELGQQVLLIGAQFGQEPAFVVHVGRVSETHVPQASWDAAAAEFSDAELGALVALVVMINAWNATAVATRAWTPEA